MAEFVYRGEKIIGIDEPITLENNTDASFDVGVGIVFRKSGLYRVSVDGKHTSVKIEPERKKGKWQWCGNHHLCFECDEWALTRWDEDECDEVDILTDFCPNCGSQMSVGEQE